MSEQIKQEGELWWEIWWLHELHGLSYEKIAARYGGKIPKITFQRILKNGVFPKNHKQREILNLPLVEEVEIPICPECGTPHYRIRKTCPEKKPSGRKHFSVSLGQVTEEEKKILLALPVEKRKEVLLSYAQKINQTRAD